MIKYLDCGKCTNESHSAWNCHKLGNCWTGAMGEMPYCIMISNKNGQIEYEFWGSIDG